MSLLDLLCFKRREECNMSVSTMKSSGQRRTLVTPKYHSLLGNINLEPKITINPDNERNGLSRLKTMQNPRPKSIPLIRPKSIPIITAYTWTDYKPQEPPDPGLHMDQTLDRPATAPSTLQVQQLRRRPKTPVRRIGQLEGFPRNNDEEFSIALSDVRAEISMPAGDDRPLTLVEILNEDRKSICDDKRLTLVEALNEPRERLDRSAPTLTSSKKPASLRKIGGRQNLRSRRSGSEPASPDFSDVETFVGSYHSPGASTRRLKTPSTTSLSSRGSVTTDSTSLYYSAVSEHDFGSISKQEKHSLQPRRKRKSSHVRGTKVLEYAHNIEMKICLDLLKKDLASALPPRNPNDSTMALQLWLMIESYESLKRRLRRQIPSKLGSETEKRYEYTFEVLDHWLEALYSVYNTQLQLQDRRRSSVV